MSNATVRLLQPECACHKAWSEEQQAKQASRIINILYSESVAQGSEDQDDDSEPGMYPAANFAFIFYFLNCELLNCGEAVGGDEKVVAMALKVIGQHAEIRLKKEDVDRKVEFTFTVNFTNFREGFIFTKLRICQVS